MRRLGHGFTARETRVKRLAQRSQFCVGLLGGGAGVVVDALQRLQGLGRAAPAPPGLGLFQRGQGVEQCMRLRVPMGVGLAAVEQRQHFGPTGLVACGQFQHTGLATVGLHLGHQRVEQGRLRFWQDVDAVTQRATTQCFQRAPDTQAHGVGLGRQGQAKHAPHL